MAKDADYRKMINSAAWRRLRMRKLLASPYCEECLAEGRKTVASEVHHRTPVERAATRAGKEMLMFDYANLESVCRECHKALHVSLGSMTSREKADRKRASARAWWALAAGERPGETPGGIF